MSQSENRGNENEVEIAAIDPVASMQAVDNPDLRPVAEQMRDKLHAVVTRAAGMV